MTFDILPGQLRLCLLICYAGMAGGVFWDLMGRMGKRGVLRCVSDVLFGIFCGGLLSAALILGGEEGIRPVTALFFLAGFGLYRMGIGRGIRFCFHVLAGRKKQHGRRKECTKERQVETHAEEHESDHGGHRGGDAGDLRTAGGEPAEWGY